MKLVNRLNEECKPPFKKGGVEYKSFLCQIGNGEPFWPYFTYVYATDKEHAKKILNEEFGDCNYREVL